MTQQTELDYNHSERQIDSWSAFDPKHNESLRFKIRQLLMLNKGKYFLPEDIATLCRGQAHSITSSIRDLRRTSICGIFTVDVDTKREEIKGILRTVYGLKE